VADVDPNSEKAKHKIMVIDDEVDILRLVRLALERWGYLVEAFNNPLNALEHFKNNPASYSLILSDIRMPGLDGIQLAKEMLKVHPIVRIMIMTAFPEMDKKVSDNISMVAKDDIVHKPFKENQICEAVRQQLER